MSRPGASPPIAIHLEGRDPMRGLVEVGRRGRRERFVGWLGLLAVLERLFDDRSAVPAPPGPRLPRRRK